MRQALLQSGAAAAYYKLGEVFSQSGTAFLYYKKGQVVLQSRAGITTWRNYYRLEKYDRAINNLCLRTVEKLNFFISIIRKKELHYHQLVSSRNNPIVVFLVLKTFSIEFLGNI